MALLKNKDIARIAMEGRSTVAKQDLLIKLVIHPFWLFGICMFHLAILVGSAFANSAGPEADLPSVCDKAAIYASVRTGVPLSVLKAISLNETGRRHGGVMRPWPWTVNMEGKGVWFDTRDAALAYVYKHFKRGARSFDLGCFQINYKWHGKAFNSIEDMFDPKKNALYAARFLLELYGEKGNWGAAAGAYHSRTEKYASRYRKRFERFRLALAGEDETPALPEREAAQPAGRRKAELAPLPRVNTYPLLQGGSQKSLMGSLMPLGSKREIIPLIGAAGRGGRT